LRLRPCAWQAYLREYPNPNPNPNPNPEQAYLREYAFPSCDPFEELLLGPAYATTAVLKASGLKLSDMDVIEFHEAFAGQARPLRRTPALTLSAAEADRPHPGEIPERTEHAARVGDG